MRNRHRYGPWVSLAAVAMVTSLAALQARAQQAHEHAHAQAEAAVGLMKLNDGRKWPTDASLRGGMAAIESAFEADHAAIHAGKQSDAAYDALAGRIEAEVNSIIANCRLPPEADANLHYVIADLSKGISLMRGGDPAHTRHDGAALVHGALLAYGKYFDASEAAP